MLMINTAHYEAYYNINDPYKRFIARAFNWNFPAHGSVVVSAPTQSLLQKWLRDVHDFHVYSLHLRSTQSYFPTFDKAEIQQTLSDSMYKTYEEALEIGLWEALKLIK